ncbi:hypothetical protein BGZ76_001270 [Entomortierella beljakovae]|nr:hypothetical protein BGZ76_001270 [Entomortierella beljakovae]
MLTGRSAAERAERRAGKTQSLYVATPSSFNSTNSINTNTTQSSFLTHQNHSGYPGQQNQPPLSTSFSNTVSTPKSPKKSRPFSMMFLHPQEELNKQQYEGYTPDYYQQQQQQQQQQQHSLNESDEDVVPDGQSLASTAIEYGESDLKEVDSDTRMLIAHLTDLDSGLPILLERVKQNLHSCKDLISFLKKRSVLEAEYGTNVLKLATGLRDNYRQQPEGAHGQAHFKQGTYGDCWSHILEMHERLGNNRLEFSRDLQVISEELSTIYKETDRSRKQFKEAGAKQERIVQEHEQNLEKAKQKYDSLTEEWERTILQKAADPTASKKTMTKGMSIFRQPKSVSQLHRQEEEAKAKATLANEQYKSQLAKTNDTRQYYYSQTLPSILKNLKDTIDESDLSLQYYLMRYGYMYEDYVMKDALVMNPINGSDLGMRDRVDLVNKDMDLKSFIDAYAIKATLVTKSATPYKEFEMSEKAQSIINPRPIFGCDLGEQLIRDEADLPEVVVKCTQAIERFGMDTKGIYRVSGITSATNRLKAAFDRDCSAVDLTSEENCGDINSVASVLKTWFRELPEPLLTRKLYPEFIKAASIDDPAEQLMSIHQVTNQLPDPNYATLKFMMCHLHKVQSNQSVNMMGSSNLGLIFGPTLTSGGSDAVNDLADMGLQCRVIEALLTNYVAIFDFEEEEEEGSMQQSMDFSPTPNNDDVDSLQQEEYEDHHHYVNSQGQPHHYEEYGQSTNGQGVHNTYEVDYGVDRMVPVAEEAEGADEDDFVPHNPSREFFE